NVRAAPLRRRRRGLPRAALCRRRWCRCRGQGRNQYEEDGDGRSSDASRRPRSHQSAAFCTLTSVATTWATSRVQLVRVPLTWILAPGLTLAWHVLALPFLSPLPTTCAPDALTSTSRLARLPLPSILNAVGLPEATSPSSSILSPARPPESRHVLESPPWWGSTPM